MTRMHLLLAAAVVIAPAAPAQAQEGERCRPARDESGEIVRRGGVALDENGDFCGGFSTGLLRGAGGKWAAPAPESALRALRRPSGPEGFDASAPAQAVLTQRFDAYSRAELDAFADEIVGIVLSEGIPPTPGYKSDAVKAALSALRLSATPDHGVPYEGAFDAMFRLWEASAGDAPPGERWDPLGTLVRLYGMEPEGRGRDILHARLYASKCGADEIRVP